MIKLHLKQQPTVPLEAECLSPDTMAALSRAELAALPVFLGKRSCRLDEFFEIDGSAEEHLELHGDLSKVKWIGRAMTRGRITIFGDAGMHLGAHMKDGAIEVRGNASDWLGAEMKGGVIHVHGHAGGQVGAAYRGSMSGMNGGTIFVERSAGLEVGMRMKRGVIVVNGPVRDFAGLQMKGGTLILMEGAEIRTGAWMTRGTIVSLKRLSLLPTFLYACTYQPTFLRLYVRGLQEMGFAIPQEIGTGMYQRYSGDSAIPGKGEILVLGAGERGA